MYDSKYSDFDERKRRKKKKLFVSGSQIRNFGTLWDRISYNNVEDNFCCIVVMFPIRFESLLIEITSSITFLDSHIVL